MAAETLLVRTATAMGVSLSVVKLEDRRPTGTSGVLQEFCLQRQVEEALYGNGYSQQTGAVYRLLQRSGVGKHTLPLKKASVASGLVTQAEYAWFYAHLGNVRSFSLIPLHAIRVALGVFGRKHALVRSALPVTFCVRQEREPACSFPGNRLICRPPSVSFPRCAGRRPKEN